MVEWKKLGDVCEKTSNIKWKDQTDDKIYKYIDLSSVSLDSHKVIITTDICKQNAPSRAQQVVCANDILLGTTRPTLKRYCQIPSYLDKNICSTGFCIFRANKEYVLSRWLFHNIGSSKFWDYCELKQQGAGYPCLSNSDAFSYMIPTPSLSEQQRIVDILDTFTSSIDNLKQQITQRRKQYEYYRDQLLDIEGKEGVEMKTLGEVCTVITGGEVPDDTIKGQLFPSPEYPYAVYTNGKETYGFTKTYQVDSDAVCISSIGANTGAIFYKVGKFTPAIRLKVLIPKKMLNTKFLYYAASIIDFRGKNTGSVPNINANYVKSKEIPVPPLSEQQRIVEILDKFEASIQNLEAQLSQREKQYEYYRNKLLTFEE